MAPRGTRRPHAKRVRSKPVKLRSGGGGSKNKGCGLILFAFAALPAIVAAVLR